MSDILQRKNGFNKRTDKDYQRAVYGTVPYKSSSHTDNADSIVDTLVPFKSFKPFDRNSAKTSSYR